MCFLFSSFPSRVAKDDTVGLVDGAVVHYQVRVGWVERLGRLKVVGGLLEVADRLERKRAPKERVGVVRLTVHYDGKVDEGVVVPVVKSVGAVGG